MNIKAGIQYVVRYTGRPVMAQSRIINYDGKNVTFYYQRHEDNKRVEVEQLEEDNIFNGLKKSVPPQPYCQKCDGTMAPVSYLGIRGVKYEFNK